MDNELTYWMALAHIGKMYTSRKNEIVAKCFNLHEPLSYFFESGHDERKETFGLTDDEADAVADVQSMLPNYSFNVENLLEQGYSIIPIKYSDYSGTLKKNLKYKAPVILYAKGNTSLLNQPSVAIVGSRDAKPVSLEFADNIARNAVSGGKVVVSGGARGIDKQALDSAVKYNGKSIVVLPQGITTYSSGFRSLYKELVSGNVLVISTFAPSAPWDKGLAMARNAIIYGLAENIYVAESNSSGGTFSGVVDGLKKGRSIFVRKPGPKEKNANLQLVQMGAVAVDMQGKEIAKDIDLEELTDEEKIRNFMHGNLLGSYAVQGQLFDERAVYDSSREFTTKEISSFLYDTVDLSSQRKVREILSNMPDVLVDRGKSPLLYKLEN